MIRYRKLGYVELNVTDLAKARDFYTGMAGLEYAGNGPEGELRLRCTDEPYSVVLYKATEPGFKRVGWMLDDERQFANIHRRLGEQGVAYEDLTPEECRRRLIGRACRMVEPNTGATIEFYLPPPNAPTRPFAPTLAKIQRLGHVVFGTPHYQEAIRFVRDVLNFRESDSIENSIAFFRAFPNPYHHGLGIGRGPRNQFHHLNFMVTEIDDIGRAFNRFRNAGVPMVYGPGRHIASGSMFLYFLDPDGLTLEYSFGMEEFPEFDARAPRTLPAVPASFDSWGAIRDPRAWAKGDIERYRLPQAAK
jgi:2,3-dihydroxy-p-cumate/2,3-dihydroxybenzoate 3,4-dioxygenase